MESCRFLRCALQHPTMPKGVTRLLHKLECAKKFVLDRSLPLTQSLKSAVALGQNCNWIEMWMAFWNCGISKIWTNAKGRSLFCQRSKTGNASQNANQSVLKIWSCLVWILQNTWSQLAWKIKACHQICGHSPLIKAECINAPDTTHLYYQHALIAFGNTGRTYYGLLENMIPATWTL